MGLIVTTPPAITPINLDEAKSHLRVDDDNSNALITTLIAAATDYVERETRQAFISRSLTLTLDKFPASRSMVLPRPPLIAVQSIAYQDITGNAATLSPSAYTVDMTVKPGRIILNDGYDWPATSSNANAMTISFSAGYGTSPANVPDILKAAIKLLIGHWFENREAVTQGQTSAVPMAVESIIQMFAFPEAVG